MKLLKIWRQKLNIIENEFHSLVNNFNFEHANIDGPFRAGNLSFETESDFKFRFWEGNYDLLEVKRTEIIEATLDGTFNCKIRKFRYNIVNRFEEKAARQSLLCLTNVDWCGQDFLIEISGIFFRFPKDWYWSLKFDFTINFKFSNSLNFLAINFKIWTSTVMKPFVTEFSAFSGLITFNWRSTKLLLKLYLKSVNLIAGS